MFRALLCPSSGTRDNDVVYHIGRVVLGLLCVGDEVKLGWRGFRVQAQLAFSCLDQLCFSLQPRHYSSLTAPNFQPTANQERYDKCDNQHHSCELLDDGHSNSRNMLSLYNKISSSI